MLKQIKIYLAALLAMLFFSFSYLWFKEANESMRPMTIVFIRLFLATIIIGSYLLITNNFIKIKKEDIKLFVALAFCEPFIYFLGESHGLTLISATVGSVMIATIPVVVSLAARIFLRELLKPINYAGILISFIGVILFVTNRTGGLDYSVKGLVLMFIAVIGAVGYGIFLGKLVDSYSPFFIIFVQNLLGTLLFLPVFLLYDLDYVITNPIIAVNLVPVIKLSAFASIGAFALFTFSVKGIGVTRTNVFANFVPVFTAILSFFLLNEQLQSRKIFGMVIIIAGLLLTQMRNGGVRNNR